MGLSPLDQEGQGTLIGSSHKDQWIGIVVQKSMAHHYQKRGRRLGRHRQQLSTELVSVVIACHLELSEEVLKAVIATQQ